MKHLLIIASLLFSTAFAFAELPSHFIYEVGIGNGHLTGNHNLSPRGVEYRDNYEITSPSLNVKAFYVFKNQMMIGLKYHSFFTTGDYYAEILNRITENITSYYIAPQVGLKFPVSSKLSLDLNAGVGYLYYLNRGLEDGAEYDMNSNLLGGNADFSLEYFLKNKISLGLNTSFQSSFYAGKLHSDANGSNYTTTPGNWDEIRINKVDLSLFLRIHI